MSPHHINWLLRFACGFLVFSLSVTLLPAFIIPVHKDITSEALDHYSEADIAKWERDQMKLGCEAADLVEGGLPVFNGPYDKRFHFDNDFTFQAITSNFVDVANLIDRNLAKPEKDPWEFGKALHAIEDLYSHSNYVQLFRDSLAANSNPMPGSFPTFEEVMLQPTDHKDFLARLKSSLHTGRYPNERLIYPKETDHGWPIGPGMNKDTLQRTLYQDARQTSVKAASWYLKLYLKEPAALQQWKKLESIRFGAAPQATPPSPAL